MNKQHEYVESELEPDIKIAGVRLWLVDEFALGSISCELDALRFFIRVTSPNSEIWTEGLFFRSSLFTWFGEVENMEKSLTGRSELSTFDDPTFELELEFTGKLNLSFKTIVASNQRMERHEIAFDIDQTYLSQLLIQNRLLMQKISSQQFKSSSDW